MRPGGWGLRTYALYGRKVFVDVVSQHTRSRTETPVDLPLRAEPLVRANSLIGYHTRCRRVPEQPTPNERVQHGFGDPELVSHLLAVVPIHCNKPCPLVARGPHALTAR